MRKQKASDKRTRRRQKGVLVMEDEARVTVTSNPMQNAQWKAKSGIEPMNVVRTAVSPEGGRGRSRKRTSFYQMLQYYHASFLEPLTKEYESEEREVLGRIEASVDDPLPLEQAGYALFDMVPERRGNLFLQQEVYRLVKAPDATTVSRTEKDARSALPAQHKFTKNDVIVLTEQPQGSGDFFSALPTSEDSTTAEAIVLSVGPTYIDIVMAAGCFAAAFGLPGNDRSGAGNPHLRLRVDQFVSNVPYTRMVSALSQLTAVPESKTEGSDPKGPSLIRMDDVLKEAILQTFGYTHPQSPLFASDATLIDELAKKLVKPPMTNSPALAQRTLAHLRAKAAGRVYNAPQVAAIEAALSRRWTLIQGPPGTGKTSVAAAIGYGFVEQCRSLSSSGSFTKVLACAFSNVGADNLAEALLQQFGSDLKVIRIGKASAVTEALWPYTLDAAIDRDERAQKALQNAAEVTAQLAQQQKKRSASSKSSSVNAHDRTVRDAATSAVKASIRACNIAATQALREADVIVTTSIGAADPRLLAACGIVMNEEDDDDKANVRGRPLSDGSTAIPERRLAPDGLPPLSLPFVIIDEACQSIEPATLIPIVASNSCRAVVLLGDPCQLPPTVKSMEASETLSLSLMERLAATLPHPNVIPGVDNTVKDISYLGGSPIKQALSVIRSRQRDRSQQSYRKVFHGSILLSIQYRMHPSIAALPSAIFYDGLLSTPIAMTQMREFPSSLRQLMPCADRNLCVRWIDVGGRNQERQGSPTSQREALSSMVSPQISYWNPAEAERVVALVKELLTDRSSAALPSIGIVTPYNGQVQCIQLLLAQDAALKDVEVKSVDGYQGRERDVIIVSTVRSNRRHRIGFLQDWRRMNVAFTRAKSALIVVSDIETLATADPHWDAFRTWANSVRCIVNDYDSLEDEEST